MRQRENETDAKESVAIGELSQMISELNEVRMRLDAVTRKMAESATDLIGSNDAVDQVEQLRLRLVSRLDRLREELVYRMGATAAGVNS